MNRFVVMMAAAFAMGVTAAEEVDGIAARVGTDSILRSEVYAEMHRTGSMNASRYRAVCERMVERKLILKAANSSKMTMQEWVVENRVREIVNKAYGGDRNKLIEDLARHRQSYPEWYAKTKEDMIISAMRWNVVDKNVTASPSAMRAEFEAHPERYYKDHKLTLSAITLKPAEAEKRDEIAKTAKEKGFKAAGGTQYVDVRPEEVFTAKAIEVISKLAVGATSDWIDLDGWSLLLKKDAEAPGTKLTFEEAYDEIEANVKEEEARKLYEAWVRRLREATYVKIY